MLRAVGSTGFGDWIDRDGKLVFLEKTVRTAPYGFLGVIFGVYLAQLGFTPVAIGIVLTATVLSSALYTLVISFLADRIGRKKTLVFFALTDFVAGTLLFVSRDWWAPVLAGIVGNMTVGAGEVGPFLSLEQAILPKTSRPDRRTLAFSVYNLVGYGASSAGALLAGLPNYIGYAPLFLGYMISGLVGAALYSGLSGKVEPAPGAAKRSALSPRGRPIVAKLSALFAIDSFGGGFMDRAFADDGLHARAFERAAHRRGVRSDGLERGLSSPVSSVVVSDGRAHEAIVRHVDRGRAGPDRGGGPHELHADCFVVDQSVVGGLRPREPLARDAVGGCGILQIGV